MKRLDQEAAGSCFRIHIAEGTHRHPATGFKLVDDAVLEAVVGQFLLESPEDLGLDGLQLKADMILDAATAFDLVGPLATKLPLEQSPLLWQGVIRSGGNLGQGEPFVVPGDHVSCAGDVDPGSVVSAFDDTCPMNVE